MDWYGLKNIDEAMEKTKEILLPFNLRTWTKIALIALFATGLGSGFNLPTATPDLSMGDSPDGIYTPDEGENSSSTTSDLNLDLNSENVTGMNLAANTSVMVVLALFLLVIGGFFMYLNALFQFIYYQTILDEKPVIIENAKKHSRKGLQYLGFRVLFLVFVLFSLIIPVGGFTVNPIVGVLLLLILWLPLVLVAVVFSGLVNHFALLKMIEDDEGLVEAWRNIWPSLREEWRQVAVFEIMRFLLGIVVSMISLLAMLVVLVVLAIPFILIAVIANFIHTALLVPVAALGVILFTVLLLYIKAPLSTYMYTYVTLNYHDVTS